MQNGTPYNTALKYYSTDIHRPLVKADFSKAELLQNYHPDYDEHSMAILQSGSNRGDRCHKQLASILQASERAQENDFRNANIIETDVLVIGGGGAGCAAALTATGAGAHVLLATKLRLGDSNTIMAEGGIQASIEKNDTPQMHFDDTFKAGHQQGDTALIKQLVLDGPDVIQWLIQQGMQFDTDNAGNLLTRRAGSTSADRVVYYRDYTGLEMMRTLRESVLNSNIMLREYNPTIKLLSNKQGQCIGAVLHCLSNKTYTVVKANATIIATGGIGRMHLNGFPTSNHLGATGDGLALAYHLGAKLRDLDSFQYHPTGLAFPENLAGTLITEGIRSAGAQLLNADGKRFINELEPRDIVAAAIIRECVEGRGIFVSKKSRGVWLDTPTLEQKKPGILNSQFPKLVELGKKSGINPHHSPLLVYPTLHYQNGGIIIDKNGQTTVQGLYCAGEASGGIHGKNRIMGNALLEIISFGRRAGLHAAKQQAKKNKDPDQCHSILRNTGRSQNQQVARQYSPLLFPEYTGFNSSVKKND